MIQDDTLLPPTLPVVFEEEDNDERPLTFVAGVLSPRTGCTSKLIALIGVWFFVLGTYVGLR